MADWVREDCKLTKPEWQRFSKWLSCTDPVLQSWQKHFEAAEIPCKIKKEHSRSALFVFQRWSVPARREKK